MFESSNSSREQALAYIEKLLNHKKIGSVFPDETTAVLGLERLLIYKHDSSYNLNPSFDQRVRTALDKIANVRFLFPGHGCSKRLFTMLLGHALSNKQEFREEVLENLVNCLETDKGYFSVWLDLYPKNISHSYNLLFFIINGWKSHQLSQLIPGAELASTAQSILDINEQILKGEYTSKNSKKPKKATPKEESDINLVNNACQTLLKKLKSHVKSESSGSSGLISGVIFIAAIGSAAYFTFQNCCDLQWCKSISFANEFLHCK